jgi:hypothetical protein
MRTRRNEIHLGRAAPYTLHPTPCTLHATPYTLHPTPCTPHPMPHTLHGSPPLHGSPYRARAACALAVMRYTVAGPCTPLETTLGQMAPPKSEHPLRMPPESGGIPGRDHFREVLFCTDVVFRVAVACTLAAMDTPWQCRTLHPAPFNLPPSPYTLHPAPYILHPTPCALCPTPHTLHPAPHTLHHTLCTLHTFTVVDTSMGGAQSEEEKNKALAEMNGLLIGSRVIRTGEAQRTPSHPQPCTPNLKP